MKNYDEFRQTVFEKAERYTAKKKARRKKIVETVSLCSLCAVIGACAYFTLGKDTFVPESADTSSTTSMQETAQAVQTTCQDEGSPEETATTTGAYMTSTVAHTSIVYTTAEATTLTTQDETSTCETVEATMTFEDTEATCTYASSSTVPTQTENEYRFHDLLDYTQKNEEMIVTLPALFVYQERNDFLAALESESLFCISMEAARLSDTFDHAFFEENVLILFLVYEDTPWSISYENGNLSLTTEGPITAENAMIYIFSVPQEGFLSATITESTQ